MRAMVENAPGRWSISAGVAVLVVAAVLALFRLPEIHAPVFLPTPKPVVTLQSLDGSNAVFDEKTQLTDPTPLFLPTKWNATQKIGAGPEPGRAFNNYPPSFSGSSPDQILPPPVAVPATPLAALLAGSPAPPLTGFGRHDVSLPELPPRGAFLEIVAEGTGRKILSRALLDAAPPGEKPWQPMEFHAAVDDVGVIGTLDPTKSSGSAEVDRYFQHYLAQTLRVGQRLPPGFYRISVGP
jgi:hypothetical protein